MLAPPYLNFTLPATENLSSPTLLSDESIKYTISEIYKGNPSEFKELTDKESNSILNLSERCLDKLQNKNKDESSIFVTCEEKTKNKKSKKIKREHIEYTFNDYIEDTVNLNNCYLMYT